MNFKPLADRVLIKPLEEEEQKVGSIIIPDTAKEKPQRGKVIALGTGKVTEDGKRQPFEVKEGDEVLFGKYSGNEIKIGDEKYIIMREDDILVVLNK